MVSKSCDTGHRQAQGPALRLKQESFALLFEGHPRVARAISTSSSYHQLGGIVHLQKLSPSTTMQNLHSLLSYSLRIVPGVANNPFARIAFRPIRSCSLKGTVLMLRSPNTRFSKAGLRSVPRGRSAENHCAGENRGEKPSCPRCRKIPEIPRQSKVHQCVTSLRLILSIKGVPMAPRFNR